MAKHELELVEFTNMCMVHDLDTNRVLVQVREKGDWDGISFPGGHIEKGEAFVPSVIREVEEETGLKISHVKLCGTKNWYDFQKQKRYVVLFFKTTSFTGKLLPCSHEGKNCWMKIEEIYQLTTAPDFLEMLDIFSGKSDCCEFFYEDTKEEEAKRWQKRFY